MEVEESTAWAEMRERFGAAVADATLKEAKSESEVIRKHMSPPGELGLNPLLERRRIEFDIVDAYFRHDAAFDRVFVYQFESEQFANGKYGDTSIWMPDTVRSKELHYSPNGVLVSAGLSALEQLRPHGILPGHIIYMADPSPLAINVDIAGALPQKMLIMNSRDISGSEDIRTALTSGRVRKVWDPKTRHYELKTPDGEDWDPLDVPEKETE